MNHDEKYFTKIMGGNSSPFPNDHEEAIELLKQLDFDLIPEIYEFNDEKYTCKYIHGVPLEQYMAHRGTPEFGVHVMDTVFNFLIECTKIERYGRYFCADDIHPSNLIVDGKGTLWIIDFDQFGFYEKTEVFTHCLGKSMQRIGMSITTNLMWQKQRKLEEEIRELKCGG